MPPVDTYLMRFLAFNKPAVAVLEKQQGRREKRGGGVAFVDNCGVASWSVPDIVQQEVVPSWDNLLDALRGAILGAWFSVVPVGEIPQLAVRVSMLVTGRSSPLPEPNNCKIIEAPSSQHGWIWDGLYVVKTKYFLVVSSRPIVSSDVLKEVKA